MSTEELDQLEEGVGRVLRKGARRAASGARRAWNKGRTLTPTQWNEALHPRDRRGRFIDVPGKILRLKHGEWYDLKEIVSTVQHSYRVNSLQQPTGPSRKPLSQAEAQGNHREPIAGRIQARTDVGGDIAGVAGITGARIYRTEYGYEVVVHLNDGTSRHEKIDLSNEVLEASDPAEELLERIRQIIDKETGVSNPNDEFEALGHVLCPCGCGSVTPGGGFLPGHEARQGVNETKQRFNNIKQYLKNFGRVPNPKRSPIKDNPSAEEAADRMDEIRKEMRTLTPGTPAHSALFHELERIKKDLNWTELEKIYMMRRKARMSDLVKPAYRSDDPEYGMREVFKSVGRGVLSDLTGKEVKAAQGIREIHEAFAKWREKMIREGKQDPDDPDVLKEHGWDEKLLELVEAGKKGGYIPGNWDIRDPFREIPAHVKRRADRLAKASGRRQFVYIDINKLEEFTDGDGVIDWDNPGLYVISDKLEWYIEYSDDGKIPRHPDGTRRLNISKQPGKPGEPFLILRGFTNPSETGYNIMSMRAFVKSRTDLKNMKDSEIEAMGDADLAKSLRGIMFINHRDPLSPSSRFSSDVEIEMDEWVRKVLGARNVDDLPVGISGETAKAFAQEQGRKQGAGLPGSKDTSAPASSKMSDVLRDQAVDLIVNNKDAKGLSVQKTAAWYDRVIEGKKARAQEALEKGGRARKKSPPNPAPILLDDDTWNDVVPEAVGIRPQDFPAPSKSVVYGQNIKVSADGRYVARERLSNGVGGGVWDLFYKSSGTKYKKIEDGISADQIHKKSAYHQVGEEIDDIFEAAADRLGRKYSNNPTRANTLIRELNEKRDMFKDSVIKMLKRKHNIDQRKPRRKSRAADEFRPVNIGPEPGGYDNAVDVTAEIPDPQTEVMPQKMDYPEDPFGKWIASRKVIDKEDPFEKHIRDATPDDTPTEEIVPDDTPTEEIVPDKPERNYIWRGNGKKYFVEQPNAEEIHVFDEDTGELIHVEKWDPTGSKKRQVRNFSKAMANSRKAAAAHAGQPRPEAPRRGPGSKVANERARQANRRVLSRSERRDSAADMMDEARELDEEREEFEYEVSAEELIRSIRDDDNDTDTPDGPKIETDSEGRTMGPDFSAQPDRRSEYSKPSVSDIDPEDMVLRPLGSNRTYYKKDLGEGMHRLYYRDEFGADHEIGDFKDGEDNWLEKLVDAAEAHDANLEGTGAWRKTDDPGKPEGDDEHLQMLDGSEYHLMVEDGGIVLVFRGLDDDQDVIVDGEQIPDDVKTPSDLVRWKADAKDRLREKAMLNAFEELEEFIDMEDRKPGEWQDSPIGDGDRIRYDKDGGFTYRMRLGSHYDADGDVIHRFHEFKRDKDGKSRAVAAIADKTKTGNKSDKPVGKIDKPNKPKDDPARRAEKLVDRVNEAMETIGTDENKWGEIVEDRDGGLWRIMGSVDEPDDVSIWGPDGRRTNLHLSDLEDKNIKSVWRSDKGFADKDDTVARAFDARKNKEIKDQREALGDSPSSKAPAKELTPQRLVDEMGWEEIGNGVYKKDSFIIRKRGPNWTITRVGQSEPLVGAPKLNEMFKRLQERVKELAGEGAGPEVPSSRRDTPKLKNKDAWRYILEAADEVEDAADSNAKPRYVWYDTSKVNGKDRGYRVTTNPPDSPDAIHVAKVMPHDKEDGHHFIIQKGVGDEVPLYDDRPNSGARISIVDTPDNPEELRMLAPKWIDEDNADPARVQRSREAYERVNDIIVATKRDYDERRRNLAERQAVTPIASSDARREDAEKVLGPTPIDSGLQEKLDNWKSGEPFIHRGDDGVFIQMYGNSEGGVSQYTVSVSDAKGDSFRYYYRDKPSAAHIQNINNWHAGRRPQKPEMMPHLADESIPDIKDAVPRTDDPNGNGLHFDGEGFSVPGDVLSPEALEDIELAREGVAALVTARYERIPEVDAMYEQFKAETGLDVSFEDWLRNPRFSGDIISYRYLEEIDSYTGLRMRPDGRLAFNPTGRVTQRQLRELRDWVDSINGDDWTFDKKSRMFVLRPDHPTARALQRDGETIRGHVLSQLDIKDEDTAFDGRFQFVDYGFYKTFGGIDPSARDDSLVTLRGDQNGLVNDQPALGGVSYEPNGTTTMGINLQYFSRKSNFYGDSPEDKQLRLVQTLAHESMHSISMKQLSDEERATGYTAVTWLVQPDIDENGLLSKSGRLGYEEGVVEAMSYIHLPDILTRLGYGTKAIDTDDMFRVGMSQDWDSLGRPGAMTRDNPWITVSGYAEHIEALEILRNGAKMSRKDFYGSLLEMDARDRREGIRSLMRVNNGNLSDEQLRDVDEMAKAIMDEGLHQDTIPGFPGIDGGMNPWNQFEGMDRAVQLGMFEDPKKFWRDHEDWLRDGPGRGVLGLIFGADTPEEMEELRRTVTGEAFESQLRDPRFMRLLGWWNGGVDGVKHANVRPLVFNPGGSDGLEIGDMADWAVIRRLQHAVAKGIAAGQLEDEGELNRFMPPTIAGSGGRHRAMTPEAVSDLSDQRRALGELFDKEWSPFRRGAKIVDHDKKEKLPDVDADRPEDDFDKMLRMQDDAMRRNFDVSEMSDAEVMELDDQIGQAVMRHALDNNLDQAGTAALTDADYDRIIKEAFPDGKPISSITNTETRGIQSGEVVEGLTAEDIQDMLDRIAELGDEL